MRHHSLVCQFCRIYIVFNPVLFVGLVFCNSTETFLLTSSDNQEDSSFTKNDDEIPVNKMYPNYVNLTYVFNETKSRRQLALEATDFVCGIDGFCNKSLSEGYFLCTFDCKPCQCGEWCPFFGNCCPDVAFQDSHNITELTAEVFNCPTETWTTWNNKSHIMMVAECPPNSDTAIATKCTHPDPTVLDQATPVSYSLVVFRNVYCAMCYGYLDYSIWRHDVVCELGSSIQFATSKADLWRRSVEDKKCSIDTKPTVPVYINECYPLQYDTCNATGSATETPSPELEELCALYSHPVVYYGSNAKKRTYRNIFCAICDGAILNTNMSCAIIAFPDVPFPLNALLDFNSQPQETFVKTNCEMGMAFDAVSKSCRNISCSLRRELVGNRCEEIFTEASGLGIRFTVIVEPVEPTKKIQKGNFKEQYLEKVNDSLQSFQPALVSIGVFNFFTYDPERTTEGPADFGVVVISVISVTTKSLLELERNLMDFITSTFIYHNPDGSNISLNSMPYLCPTLFQVPTNVTKVSSMDDFTFNLLKELDPRCEKTDCNVYINYEKIQLPCPFIEYNVSEDALSFDSDKKLLQIGGQVIELPPKRFVKCGDILRVCVDDVVSIIKIGNEMHVPEDDYTLSVISLVCVSLSLAGLVLTFLTYCLIPKLRTLPGKNNMALVLNLFLAQLVFLTTSNRTSNILHCKIFAVLNHYFWLSSFAWMVICAYHMFTVFTRLRALTRDPINDNHIIKRYALICFLLPLCVVGICLILHLARSDGAESGYGGRVCFLNNRMAVGVFFAAPLVLMLLLNTFFFVCTVRSISSTPDMKTSSNKHTQHHIFAYFKLSLLFGFTWTFGMLSETIQSKVLSYMFAILTGSQGFLIFVSYCVNKMSWDKLKEALGNRHAQSKASTHTKEGTDPKG